MDEISADKSLDFYLTTLSYLDEKYINGSDDDINYYVLTELDSDAHTFLNYYTVDLLVDEGLIPESVADDTENLRTIVKDLIERKRTLNEIRFDDEWKNARQLAKKILTEIKMFQDSKS